MRIGCLFFLGVNLCFEGVEYGAIGEYGWPIDNRLFAKEGLPGSGTPLCQRRQNAIRIGTRMRKS